MHAARSLTISPSMLCSGGVPGPRGAAWSRGGGWGCVVSQHSLRQTPPLWTESQTPVKILPCPNSVAGGNNSGTWKNDLSARSRGKFYVISAFSRPLNLETSGAWVFNAKDTQSRWTQRQWSIAVSSTNDGRALWDVNPTTQQPGDYTVHSTEYRKTLSISSLWGRLLHNRTHFRHILWQYIKWNKVFELT